MKQLSYRLLFLIFCCVTFQSFGQTKGQCGTYEKSYIPIEPTHTDRFGNLYNQEELLAPRGSAPSLCKNLKVFDLDFKSTDPKVSFTNDQIETICEVFEDIEKNVILDKPKNGTKIRIEIIRTPLEENVLANATPYYEKASCGIAQSTVFNALKGGTYLPNEIMGTIRVATAFSNYWHYKKNDNNPPLAAWFDLYSVMLHEAMHILAFASKINPNTGNPLVDPAINDYSYSRWDEFLYKEDLKLPLLTKSSNDHCCELKDFDYKHIPTSTFFKGCKDADVWFRNQSGTNIATISCDGGDLSHLSNDCKKNPLQGDFVMNPYITNNVTNRFLSREEKDILCAYGYNVVAEECEIGCNAFAIKDNLSDYIKIGDVKELNVLANDIYDPLDYGWELASYDAEGLEVIADIATGKLTIKAIKNGEWNICYKLWSCKKNKCMTSCFKIVVIDPDLDKCCDKVKNCNLTCLGDFEAFTSTFELRHFLTGQTTITANNAFLVKGGINTIDLLFEGSNDADYCRDQKNGPIILNGAKTGANNTKKYLGFWSKKALDYNNNDTPYDATEGFDLPLCKRIIKGTKVAVTFWARRSEMCANLNAEIQLTLPSGGNQAINHKFVKIDSPDWQQYTVNFAPYEGEDACKLLISGIVGRGAPDDDLVHRDKAVYFHIDEIEIIYEEQFKITSQVLYLDCKKDEGTVAFTVCNQNLSCENSSGDVSPEIDLILSLPNGVTIVPNKNPNGFIGKILTIPVDAIKPGKCETYTATITGFAKTLLAQQSAVVVLLANVKSKCAPPIIKTAAKLENCSLPYSVCLSASPVPSLNLVWGSQLGTTNFSSIGSLNQTWTDVTVHGTLIMDVDYDFKDKFFYMEEGSEIVIPYNKKVSFDGCTLQGCNFMWKGINVENGRLNFTNNLISDAHWAIRANSGRVYANDNSFQNNFYGMYFENYSNLQSNITKNRIYGVGNLLPLYAGQDPIVLLRGNISRYGISLQRSFMKVGDTNDKTLKNVFSDLSIGIEVKNSYYIQAYNNEFNNIDKGPKGPFYFHYAILLLNSNGHIANNEINSGADGIAAFGGVGGTLNIVKNKLIDVSGNGIEIYNRTGSYIDVNDNLIDLKLKNNRYTGISLYRILKDETQEYGHLRVINNEIRTGDIFNDGIRVIECYSRNEYLIKDNLIIPYKASSQTQGGNSIHIINSANFQVENNGIGSKMDGIRLEDTDACMIRENFTNQKGKGYDDYSGIYANNSNGNIYCCNTMHNKKNALHFEGSCLSSNGINTTDMQNYEVGILYGYDQANGITAITGEQNLRGNIFLDFNGAVDAKHEDPDDKNVALSGYICNYFPSIMPDNVVSSDPDWFTPVTGQPLTTCDEPDAICKKTGFKLGHLDSLIVNNYFVKANLPTMQWQTEHYLYRQLSDNPEYVQTNALMAKFYEEKATSNIGLVYDIRKEMFDTDFTNTFSNELSSIDAKIEAMSEELVSIKNDEYKAQSINAELKPLLAQWAMMQANVNDYQKAKWGDIGTKNKAFVPTNDAEKIEKSVNQYVVNYHLQDNSLSNSDLSNLYQLASLCSSKNSTAIFRARTLYELVKNMVIDWSLIENCKGNTIPIGSKISKQTTGFHANVFPNPTTNQITIQVENVKNFSGEAVFYNLQGQEVYRRSISGNDTFDIENLGNGMYYIQLQQAGVCLETHKIVLIK